MREEKDEKRGETCKTNSIQRGRPQEVQREEQQDNKRRMQGKEKEPEEEPKEEKQITTNRVKVRGGKDLHPRWSAAWKVVREKYPGVATAWHIDNPAPKSVKEDDRWKENNHPTFYLLEEDDRREEQNHPTWSAAYEKVRSKFPRGVAYAWYKTNPAPKSVEEDSLWEETPICSQRRFNWNKNACLYHLCIGLLYRIVAAVAFDVHVCSFVFVAEI